MFHPQREPVTGRLVRLRRHHCGRAPADAGLYEEEEHKDIA